MKLNVKKLQNGGLIYKSSPTNNKKLNINKELKVNNLTPLDPIKVNPTKQFTESKNNFLNLPKTQPLLKHFKGGLFFSCSSGLSALILSSKLLIWS